MSSEPELAPVLRTWLRDRTSTPSGAGLARALDLVAGTPQRRSRAVGPTALNAGRSRTMLAAARLLAAVAIVALGAGALFLAAVQGPSPVPTARPASPSPTAAPSARLGQGPVLTWTRVVPDERSLKLPDPSGRPERTATAVAWVDGRFILADEDAEAVSTSEDGIGWIVADPDGHDQDYLQALLMDRSATWQDRLVAWNWDVGGLRIVRPPDAPIVNPSLGGRVTAVGIGPAGIVAAVQSDFDHDALVTSIIGPNWVEHMTSYERRDGVIHIRTDDDRSADIVMAEHGIEEGDLSGFGWFSPDGAEWAPIPEFPRNVQEVVGVSDGFVARARVPRCDGCPDGAGGMVSCDGCADAAMWYSPDGLAWREIGPTFWEGPLLPWAGGAVVVEPESGRFDAWTTEGVRELPMSTEVPDRSSEHDTVGVGPLGIVSLDHDAGEVVFSPDGIAWSIAPLPGELAQSAAPVAVGERGVLVLSWTWEGEVRVPSLWLGTLAP